MKFLSNYIIKPCCRIDSSLKNTLYMAIKEYFPEIGKIKFEGKESKNPLAYRYYDAEKVVMGKKMKDWLKFSMAYIVCRRR